VTTTLDTVTMGARSFMELKTYFDQVYGADGENVMVECIICQEMVLKVRINRCYIKTHGTTLLLLNIRAPHVQMRSAMLRCILIAQKDGSATRPTVNAQIALFCLVTMADEE